MKLPRLKYSKRMEEVFEKAEQWETLKTRKDAIMKFLESAKDLEDLDSMALGAILESCSKVPTQEELTLKEEFAQAFLLDEICFIGWLRYQVLLGKNL